MQFLGRSNKEVYFKVLNRTDPQQLLQYIHRLQKAYFRNRKMQGRLPAETCSWTSATTQLLWITLHDPQNIAWQCLGRHMFQCHRRMTPQPLPSSARPTGHPQHNQGSHWGFVSGFVWGSVPCTGCLYLWKRERWTPDTAHICLKSASLLSHSLIQAQNHLARSEARLLQPTTSSPNPGREGAAGRMLRGTYPVPPAHPQAEYPKMN